jgi:hypothetical protein
LWWSVLAHGHTSKFWNCIMLCLTYYFQKALYLTKSLCTKAIHIKCTHSKTVYNTLQCSSHLKYIKTLCNILHIPTWRAYHSFTTTVSQLKICDFSGEILKVLKCYNFLWVKQWHNCSPEACFANCVMTLYLLKVHLQTFLSMPITQKCQILSCDALVANDRYGHH